MKFLAAAAIGFVCLLAVSAGVAWATVGGGSSIANAPFVTPGTPTGGNTATYTDTCQTTKNGYEFWMLHLTQGDLVKITWSWNEPQPPVDTLALFAAGTTDANNNGGCYYNNGWSLWTAPPILSGSAPAQTIVPADGNYPLLFLDTSGANAGAYSFTAQVLHTAAVTLPQFTAAPQSGVMTVAVNAPDQTPITDSTLKLTLNGFWSNRSGAAPSAHKLATVTPSNGLAKFTYTVPARLLGTKIRLNVTGSGATWQAVTTKQVAAKVYLYDGAPTVLSAGELATESKLLHKPIYWAGPLKGDRLEYTHTANGYSFVRYLPHGAKAGITSTKFLVVATYPLARAYKSLQKYAHGKASAGPNGSIYFADPAHPKSVYVAFPKVNFEIEVYDPSPKVARAIAASGEVQPVRS